MQVYSYDHIHLRSPKPAETAQWYQRMFDAKIIETPQPSGPNRVDLDINGLMVFIAGAMPQGEEIQGLRDPHYGLDHFGLSPNPPKDTDGRREDSGRGWVRELQGRWPGVLG